MTTLASIWLEVANEIAAEFTDDLVQSCTVRKITQGAYNNTTGQFATTSADDTGRCIMGQVSVIPDIFPDQVVGPTDRLYYAGELSVAPVENDNLIVGGETLTILRVLNYGDTGGMFAMVARG